MILLQGYIIFTDSSLYIEILLIAVIVALIGAAGYTILHFSMRNDSLDNSMARYSVHRDSPWETLQVQDTEEKPKPQRTITKKRLIVKLIQIAALLLPLILLFLAIKLNWFSI